MSEKSTTFRPYGLCAEERLKKKRPYLSACFGGRMEKDRKHHPEEEEGGQ